MPKHLTDEENENFTQNGYITLKNCFTTDDIREWIDRGWVRIGSWLRAPGPARWSSSAAKIVPNCPGSGKTGSSRTSASATTAHRMPRDPT